MVFRWGGIARRTELTRSRRSMKKLLRLLGNQDRLLSESNLLARSEIMREIIQSGCVTDDTGRVHVEATGIQLSYAEALYEVVCTRRPRLVVEIGMANGISSLAILTALRDSGGEGRLLSVDPYQWTTWKGMGLTHVQRAGFEHMHTLIEAPDYLALPELLRAQTQVDMAYVDGWHTFDYTLLDWWYLDKMLVPGGVIGLNDCGYRAVHRVISFFCTHRKYRELDFGLTPDYLRSRLLWTAVRRISGWTLTDRYFEKIASWEPAWNFYSRF
jgi:predicted O-methyltransferase YrrM